MFARKNIVIFFTALLLSNSACIFSYEGEVVDGRVNVIDKKSDKFKIIELEGSGDICQWVIDRFNSQSGELDGAYDWINVKAELLKYPKEYFGYIKYLSVDIDNDGKKEYLAKVTTYLGGTLSALNLIVTDRDALFNAQVSVDNLPRNANFSLNVDGKKTFLRESNKLRKSGVDITDPRLVYGYSAYQLQNKLIDVFKFKGKNYLLLNNYQDPYVDKLGLVVGINNSLDDDLEVRQICFFK